MPPELRDGPEDLTAGVADAPGFSHPYLFVDVEFPPGHCYDLRADFHDRCSKKWHEDLEGDGQDEKEGRVEDVRRAPSQPQRVDTFSHHNAA